MPTDPSHKQWRQWIPIEGIRCHLIVLGGVL
jgi:hypothetical protein